MAQEKTRHSDYERGRNALADELTKDIATMKALTDGPQREDWQLGYAAACREISDLIRRTK